MFRLHARGLKSTIELFALHTTKALSLCHVQNFLLDLVETLGRISVLSLLKRVDFPTQSEKKGLWKARVLLLIFNFYFSTSHFDFPSPFTKVLFHPHETTARETHFFAPLLIQQTHTHLVMSLLM